LQTDSPDCRVLVFAPIGRDAGACADILCRAGMSVLVCADIAALVDAVEAGAGAVFVAEEGLFGKDTGRLTAWVAGQPAWSDLPFVVLTSRHEEARVVTWRQRLTTSLRNVSLLERPIQPITLTLAIRAALRARMRQYEVRALLDERERAAAELEALVAERTQALQETNAELRKQMTERARVEESLRQSQKIEAVGQLTGGIAHDFNNLLMVISGGLEMLQRHTEQERRERLLEGMRQAAQRGSALTRQLLAFSRRQTLKPEPVNVAWQIEGMRELLDRSLRGDVQVALRFADDLWNVEVDAGELELVILNLAVNARDAMPNGGTITISAQNLPAFKEEGLDGDYVRLSIADTGTGMPPEVLAHVFEPFYTTKEVGKGSGLGLAQVHGFAKQSQGGVRIRSELGRGATIELYLPRTEKAARGAPQSTEATIPRTQQRCAGCVLLVEDDDEVAKLTAEMLEQIGFEVIRAASAAAALGALANGRAIDLVFSDIMMPGGMNGVELAKEIRRRRLGLPVLLTSGYAEAARREAEAEGVRILPKPYRLSELSAALVAVGEIQGGQILQAGQAVAGAADLR
jgi:signal transduction histidine kinase/ActR/RegA family two-component response regulator